MEQPMRIEWMSFAIGAVVATGLLGGGVLLGRVAPSESEGPTSASVVRARSPGEAFHHVKPVEAEEAAGGLVRWLSARLEEAYRQAALPEVVGTEAGRIAGEQAIEYVYEDYDPEEIGSELAAGFEALDDDGHPWRIQHRDWDCAEAPCVLRIDLGQSDGGAIEDCPAALESMLAVLDQAVPAAALDYFGANTGGGRCWTEFPVMTRRSGRRNVEIEAGVQGWLEATKRRTPDIAPLPEASQ